MRITKTQLLKIIKNGGATLDKNGAPVNFSSGYQVSKKDCFILSTENTHKILKAVNVLLDEIGRREYVGLWVDDGKVYVDISVRICNRATAVNFGKMLRQISIFEWSTKNCLTLEY